jgi:hypothetical protein
VAGTTGGGRRGKKELAVEGGTRPRLRRADARTMTRAKEKAFLTALAESCNVKYAAEAAGVSTTNIYVRRAKDAKFRASWDRALAIGYAQLELMMLERALHGVEKIIVARDGSRSVMREYSDRLGLGLLRMHRDNAAIADSDHGPEEVAEAAERILARLKKIGEQGKVETKSGAGLRIGLIAWGLSAGRS